MPEDIKTFLNNVTIILADLTLYRETVNSLILDLRRRVEALEKGYVRADDARP